jgi:hypothetical protein
MYLRLRGWELWLEIVPWVKPFLEVDSCRRGYIMGALWVSVTINRRL